MVGSLPSRAVATMFSLYNTSPPVILLADNILLFTSFEADLRRYFAAQYSWLTVCDLFVCFKFASIATIANNKICCKFFYVGRRRLRRRSSGQKARYLMWQNTDTTVFRGDIVLRKSIYRVPFRGIGTRACTIRKTTSFT